MASQKDLFGVNNPSFLKPITADTAIITWGAGNASAAPDIVTGANNIQLSYQRAANRRYALGASPSGGPVAVIYPTRPAGSMFMTHLFVDNTNLKNLFTYPGWDACSEPAVITVTFGGKPSSLMASCKTTKAQRFILSGALVTGWSLQAEADGLTIVQSVTIDFVHLETATA